MRERGLRVVDALVGTDVADAAGDGTVQTPSEYPRLPKLSGRTTT